jgi:hypothetical protein
MSRQQRSQEQRMWSPSEVPKAALLHFAAEGSLSSPLSVFQADSDPSGAKTTNALFGISEKGTPASPEAAR